MRLNKLRLVRDVISTFLTLTILFTCASAVFTVSAAPYVDIPLDPLFQSRSIINNTKYPRFKLKYRLFVPDDYKTKKYPIVIHYAGDGQSGSDNVKQLEFPKVMPKLLMTDKNREKYPCIIIVPQCPAGTTWVTNFYGEISRPLDLSMDIISLMIENYNADPGRIYVTGFSSGGSAVWDIISRYPYTFAAGMPFAGYTAPSLASRMKYTPIWAFHAKDDPTVPVSQSRQMVQALKAAGGNIRYNEPLSDEHGASWVYAYNSSLVLPWMFSQKSNNTMPPSDITTSVPVVPPSSAPSGNNTPGNNSTVSKGQAVSGGSATSGGKGQTESKTEVTYNRTKNDIVDVEEPVTEEARKEAQALLKANPLYKEDPAGADPKDAAATPPDDFSSVSSGQTGNNTGGDQQDTGSGEIHKDVFDPEAQQKKNNLALILITAGICAVVAAGVIVCIVLYKKGILFKDKDGDTSEEE